MRILCGALLFFLLGGALLPAQTEVIFQRKDPRGDDRGAGGLLYPEQEVFVAGLFDLLQFRVSADQYNVYFDFRFAKITNPFQAPEGYFHQRLEVYLDSSFPGGNESILAGGRELKTEPARGWEVRLTVAPFQETRLFIWSPAKIEQIEEGVCSYLLEDGCTIRAVVPRILLPEPDPGWRYYVLVGSFDGLSAGFWRDLGPDPLWQVGGEGLPVFDLLAPRWGPFTQKRQLSAGVLRPVGPGRWEAPWFRVVLVSSLGLGFLFSIVFFLQRRR